jgi:hypothetical protein
VVAVHAVQQRLARDDAGLAAVDRELLHEPVALAEHLALGVAGAGQHLAEQREQSGQPGAEHRAAEAEPVGVRAGRQLRTERLHVGGELRGVAPVGAGQQGVAEQLRLRGVRDAAAARRPGERDAQAHLRQRHARTADGEHAQPVVERALGDGRQLGARGGPSAGRGAADGGARAAVMRASRAELEQGAGVGAQRRRGGLHGAA